MHSRVLKAFDQSPNKQKQQDISLSMIRPPETTYNGFMWPILLVAMITLSKFIVFSRCEITRRVRLSGNRGWDSTVTKRAITQLLYRVNSV